MLQKLKIWLLRTTGRGKWTDMEGKWRKGDFESEIALMRVQKKGEF